MTKALVVLSGGQDSTTCLGWALDNYEEVCCVTFDYGQRHKREIDAALDVVRYFEKKVDKKIFWETIELGEDVFIGDSPLTNRNQKLETYENHDEMEKIIGGRVELTFVPMRNAVFLMIAANRAVVRGCDVIVTGVCQGDNANYPDCRETFILDAEKTINRALGRPLQGSKAMLIKTPLMHLSKAETVRMALGTPHTYGALAFSHTAYDGAYPPLGGDHASTLRAHGFAQASTPDPLILRAYHEGALTTGQLEAMGDLYTGEVAKHYSDLHQSDWKGQR